MIKMKTIILILLGYINVFGSFAQEQATAPSTLTAPPSDNSSSSIITIPPSPDAGHLGTYGEFSVSKVTGSADISIPILALQEGGITIPITLSYQSAGLRVDERPSWVGMGWLLSAGGVITRTIRGRCDDMQNGFFQNSTSIPDKSLIDRDLELPVYREDIYDKLASMITNEVDYVPDAFSFNFGGNSGSFFFGNDENVHCVDHNSLKFEPIFGVIESIALYPIIVGWKVTDDNGLMYTFSAIETTSIRTYDSFVQKYISAWYLKSISNPLTGTAASFEYHVGDYRYIDTEQTKSFTYEKGSSDLTYIQVSNSPTTSTQEIRHEQLKFLSKVTLGDYEVDFSISSALQQFWRLNSIQWKNGSASKQFMFNYGTFDCGGTSCDRLKLTSLTEEYPTDTDPESGLHYIDPQDPKVYSFDYYDGGVPDKGSFAQDHWGFYNGRGNSSLVPTVMYAGQEVGDGAIRDPDYRSTLVGMLSSITYPTGGLTEFSYEQNTWEDKTGTQDVEEETENYTITATGISGHQTVACEMEGLATVTTSEYTTRVEYEGKLIYDRIDMRDVPILTITEYPSNDVIETHELHSGVIARGTLAGGNPSQTYFLKLCVNGATGVNSNGDLRVQKAEVNFKVIKTITSSVDQPIARPTGGLRISKIVNTDLSNGTESTVTRSFDYGHGGYLVWRSPVYTSGYSNVNNQTEVGSTFLVVSSSPTGGLGPSSMPVAYNIVNEWLGTKTSNIGRIETVYKKVTDHDHVGAMTPQQSKHSERIKVNIQNYYDSAGRLIKYEDFDYDDQYVASVTGFRASGTSHSPRDYENDFRTANFTFNTTWHKLRSKKTVYTLNAFTETVSYEHASNLHTNPTRETLINSKDEEIHKGFTYPIDNTTCTNNCFTNYSIEKNNCALLTVDHAIEAGTCMGMWQNCNTNYLACKKSYQEEIDRDCYPLETLSLPCVSRKQKEANCSGKFNNCLNGSGYFSCLDNLSYKFVGCQKTAFVNYRLCQSNFDDCLLVEYEDGVQNHQNAIALLNIGNIQSKPIELKTLKGTTELSSTFFQYNIWNEKPLQESISISYQAAEPTKLLTINKYDSKGNPLEVLDHKAGFLKSYIWGHDKTLLIAEFQNAPFGEVAYSSFETGPDEGNLSFQTSQVNEGKTGNQSHLLSGKPITKTGLNPSTRYVVSFWAKSGTPSVTGIISSHDGVAEPDGWMYYEKIVSGVTSVVISGTGSVKIDEVRIAPENSIITTFTHQPGFGITSSTDTNNQTTFYKYDTSGKLKTVKDHYHNIIRYLEYNYQD